MALDAFLTEVLACPCANHAPVEVHADHVQCLSCDTTFPVRQGIPVMLLADATPGPRGIGAAREGSRELT
jgi:uncharacterized protein YbaR (Trm112 family)